MLHNSKREALFSVEKVLHAENRGTPNRIHLKDKLNLLVDSNFLVMMDIV